MSTKPFASHLRRDFPETGHSMMEDVNSNGDTLQYRLVNSAGQTDLHISAGHSSTQAVYLCQDRIEEDHPEMVGRWVK